MLNNFVHTTYIHRRRCNTNLFFYLHYVHCTNYEGGYIETKIISVYLISYLLALSLYTLLYIYIDYIQYNMKLNFVLIPYININFI